MHHRYIQMCRIIEWKRKKGRCPYDANIVSKSLKTNKTRKLIKNKQQKTIGEY